jgi:hypothetical protein
LKTEKPGGNARLFSFLRCSRSRRQALALGADHLAAHEAGEETREQRHAATLFADDVLELS